MKKSLYDELTRIYKEGDGDSRLLRILTDGGKPVWLAWLARAAKSSNAGDVSLSGYSDDTPCTGGIMGVTPFSAVTADGSVRLVPTGAGAAKVSFPSREPDKFSVKATVSVAFHGEAAKVSVSTPSGDSSRVVQLASDIDSDGIRIPMLWPDGCGVNGDLLFSSGEDKTFEFRTVPRYPYKTAFSMVQSNEEAVDIIVRTGMMDLWASADDDAEKLTAAVVAAIKFNTREK